MNKLAPIIPVQNLKKYINGIRDIRKETIKSNDLNEEQLYYLQEGFREGLCAAAMYLADELDAEIGEGHYLELEEQWWHHHNDEDDNIDTDEQELLSQIDGDSAKQIKSKELFEYLLKLGKCYDFYKYLIWELDYEDVLNDYICEYMDINNCFPPEDD